VPRPPGVRHEKVIKLLGLEPAPNTLHRRRAHLHMALCALGVRSARMRSLSLTHIAPARESSSMPAPRVRLFGRAQRPRQRPLAAILNAQELGRCSAPGPPAVGRIFWKKQTR
jgi:hypothetical protein